MRYLTLETTQLKSEKEPIPLGYEYDGPRKRSFHLIAEALERTITQI